MSVAKISPRQKMINVMYLILTDMLALNVSSEILKAFFLMETSMDMTSENVQQKNRDLLVAYDRQLGTQPDLVRPFYVKAKEAEKLAAEFDQYVENLKNILIEETGGREESSDGKKTELVGKDDIEKHADFLINKKKGDELKIKISEIREKLLALLAPEERNEVISDLVRNLPKPEIRYGTLDGSTTYSKGAVLAQRMMVAGLGGIYVRGLHYSVKSYTMSIADSRNGIQSTIQVNGQYASGDVQAALNRMAPGSIVIFENIKVDKMPRKTFQLVLRTR